MAQRRRINVSSGRPLEHRAHYSRALRVGDWVLQSGTTAINTAGEVIGEGDVGAQVDAIVGLAEESMGQAGGRLEDVVRSRVYVTDMALADAAGRALARHFRDVRPALTLTGIAGLARPAQLVEIEFDAIDGANERAVRVDACDAANLRHASSRAVRVDDQVFIAGMTALSSPTGGAPDSDVYGQTRAAWDAVLEAADAAGAVREDVVYSKTFVTDVRTAAAEADARIAALGDVRPTGMLLGVPGFRSPAATIEVEAEAIVGAASKRHDYGAEAIERPSRGHSRVVEVEDQLFVSGQMSWHHDATVHGRGDWAMQLDRCHERIREALAEAGASLDDVVRRRTFTTAQAQQNRAYGDGAAWFEASRPVSLGCRVPDLAHPHLLVSMDAYAVRGAHRDIEWRSLEEG